MALDGQLINPQPYGRLIPVTKSDVTVYDPPLDGLWVGGTGAVAVVDMTGASVTITSIPDGQLLPFKVRQVLETGTDATDIVGVRW